MKVGQKDSGMRKPRFSDLQFETLAFPGPSRRQILCSSSRRAFDAATYTICVMHITYERRPHGSHVGHVVQCHRKAVQSRQGPNLGVEGQQGWVLRGGGGGREGYAPSI